MLHVPGLYIAHSEGRGRGVFTSIELSAGDIIEFCPIVIVPKEDQSKIHHSFLHDYYFLSPAPDPQFCLVFGYGSIYNHQSTANAEIVFDIPNLTIEIHCIVAIEPGTEIFIDYTGGIKDAPKLWFDPV